MYTQVLLYYLTECCSYFINDHIQILTKIDNVVKHKCQFSCGVNDQITNNL
jgi:hypothetical protein